MKILLLGSDGMLGSEHFSLITYDLAQAVLRLVEERRRGICHVTNQGRCSWYEFAKAIQEYAGFADVEILPIKADELKRPAKRPCYSVLDGSKFFRNYGNNFTVVAYGASGLPGKNVSSTCIECEVSL